MENYVTGNLIKELREKKGLTQLELSNILLVSDKTISKWETGKGLPDISLLDDIAKSLDISLIELMNGEYICNKNISSNMIKSIFYVCPVCGNVIHTIGESIVCCCGIKLPVLDYYDGSNLINISLIENEYYIYLNHEMSKKHYISFIAYVTNDRCEVIKLYPEQNAEVRFLKRDKGFIYAYCNRDGLYKKVIK